MNLILDGKIVAQEIEHVLHKEVEKLKSRGVRLALAVVLVGNNPASVAYVRAKELVAEKLGIDFRVFHFATNAREDQVLKLISELNENHRLHGIIVQLPLPDGFDSEKIINSIDPKKDVDGLLGKIPPPAVQAVMELMDYYALDWKGRIVLVGHGRLVGAPLRKILEREGIEPVICDSETADLKAKTLSADIIVSATGVPGLIKKDMVSKKAVVIDAGTAESGGSVKGDVDPEVYKKVKAYSPVPGGVGPLTVIELIKNVVDAAKL